MVCRLALEEAGFEPSVPLRNPGADGGLTRQARSPTRLDVARDLRVGCGFPPRTTRSRNILRRELRDSDLPYVFCLLLSFPFHFRQWATAHIPPTGPHRSLFERVSEQACQRLFPNWLVTSFGWSPETTMRKGEIVDRVAGALHSSVRDPSVFENSNDAGVDILCHLLLSDSWGGYPAIMVQCATGRTDYKEKLSNPTSTCGGQRLIFGICLSVCCLCRSHWIATSFGNSPLLPMALSLIASD
jgi:hypothetical protein